MLLRLPQAFYKHTSITTSTDHHHRNYNHLAQSDSAHTFWPKETLPHLHRSMRGTATGIEKRILQAGSAFVVSFEVSAVSERNFWISSSDARAWRTKLRGRIVSPTCPTANRHRRHIGRGTANNLKRGTATSLVPFATARAHRQSLKTHSGKNGCVKFRVIMFEHNVCNLLI